MNQSTKKGLVGFLFAVLAAFGIYLQPKPLPTPPPAATPAPAPTGSPSPASSPLPTQAPEPSPLTPGLDLCRLPASTGRCTWPPEGRAQFEEDVFMAQETAKQNGYLTPDGRVKDERLYTNEVARLLRTDGYCAINGNEAGHTSYDEVWVKKSNSHTEHFDIIRADGVPILLFAARCVPAAF